jgi:membrane-anchored protein YejM (alkaline phosphatase superfamily)
LACSTVFRRLYGRRPLGAYSAALITALNQQGYQLGLFSSDGFSSPLYRQALLSDFSLPSAKTQSDEQTANQWIGWLDRYAG